MSSLNSSFENLNLSADARINIPGSPVLSDVFSEAGQIPGMQSEIQPAIEYLQNQVSDTSLILDTQLALESFASGNITQPALTPTMQFAGNSVVIDSPVEMNNVYFGLNDGSVITQPINLQVGNYNYNLPDNTCFVSCQTNNEASPPMVTQQTPQYAKLQETGKLLGEIQNLLQSLKNSVPGQSAQAAVSATTAVSLSWIDDFKKAFSEMIEQFSQGIKGTATATETAKKDETDDKTANDTPEKSETDGDSESTEDSPTEADANQDQDGKNANPSEEEKQEPTEQEVESEYQKQLKEEQKNLLDKLEEMTVPDDMTDDFFEKLKVHYWKLNSSDRENFVNDCKKTLARAGFTVVTFVLGNNAKWSLKKGDSFSSSGQFSNHEQGSQKSASGSSSGEAAKRQAEKETREARDAARQRLSSASSGNATSISAGSGSESPPSGSRSAESPGPEIASDKPSLKNVEYNKNLLGLDKPIEVLVDGEYVPVKFKTEGEKLILLVSEEEKPFVLKIPITKDDKPVTELNTGKLIDSLKINNDGSFQIELSVNDERIQLINDLISKNILFDPSIRTAVSNLIGSASGSKLSIKANVDLNNITSSILSDSAGPYEFKAENIHIDGTLSNDANNLLSALNTAINVYNAGLSAISIFGVTTAPYEKIELPYIKESFDFSLVKET